MGNVRKVLSKTGLLFMSALLFMAVAGISPQKVRATSTEGAPSQADCSSGSTTYTWDGEGIDRPVIASLSVDGEAVADPTNPTSGSIGVAICPSVELGRRTGLFVYYRNGSTNDFDLTNAVTPLTSSPITAESDITITMTDMGGGFAPRYSFSLIHGAVSNWETSGLGTQDAAISVTMSPVRTPYGNGPDFNFCTATPPNCNAEKSDVDALAASMDMTFDESGAGQELTGAYFAMTGAMAGFVQAERQDDGSSSLVATLGAPHFLANGTTVNTGSMQAFLPTSVLEDLLEVAPGEVDEESLAVARTESGTTEEAPFSITPVEGGVVVRLSNITFSSPTYTISKASASSTPGLPDTGVAPNKSTLLAPASIVGIVGLAAIAFALRRRIIIKQ